MLELLLAFLLVAEYNDLQKPKPVPMPPPE